VADGGFQQLLFKSAPIFPDPQCPSGTLYMINFAELKWNVMAGGDFAARPFIEDSESNAMVSKIYVCSQLCIENRFLNNKVTGITA
jgi:hypothetical protein